MPSPPPRAQSPARPFPHLLLLRDRYVRSTGDFYRPCRCAVRPLGQLLPDLGHRTSLRWPAQLETPTGLYVKSVCSSPWRSHIQRRGIASHLPTMLVVEPAIELLHESMGRKGPFASQQSVELLNGTCCTLHHRRDGRAVRRSAALCDVEPVTRVAWGSNRRVGPLRTLFARLPGPLAVPILADQHELVSAHLIRSEHQPNPDTFRSMSARKSRCAVPCFVLSLLVLCVTR